MEYQISVKKRGTWRVWISREILLCISEEQKWNLLINPAFNSYEWPRKKYSLQYQYLIKQASNENWVKSQVGDYKLIQY